MSQSRVRILALIGITGFGLAFWGGFLARGLLDNQLKLGLLREAYQLLETHYIEPLPQEPVLQRGMVRGMLETLDDPYTVYTEPQQHVIQADTLSGEYGGIGALITTDGKGNYHLEPFPGSPAALAGVAAGAHLLAVDGAPLNEEGSLEAVVARLRGPIGTSVRIRIRLPGADRAQEFIIERERIPLPSVTGYILPGSGNVGVIAINVFSERTPEEVAQTVGALVDREADRFILDLRNNGGGLLDSAVGIARIFMREGMIVAEERRGTIQETYHVEHPGPYADIPLIAVVDGTTASAAEVVAAALQASQRSILLGSRTYGKGSIQVLVELSDGSSMRITSSRWLTPTGIALDSRGLVPDVLLEPDLAGSDAALIQAAELLREGKVEE